MKFSRRPAAAFACLLPLLAAVAAAAETQADIKKIEAEISELSGSLRYEFNPATYLSTADGLVQRLEIEPPSLDYDPEGRRLMLADGSPADYSVYRVELAGSAPFSKVYTYLTDFWGMFQIGVKLEELRLEAQPGNKVAFRARYGAVHPTLPVVPFPKKPTPEHTERRRLTLELLHELAKDTQDRGLLDSLGFLAEKLDPVAVGFSLVELKEGQGKIEGAALGPTAAAALEAALAESGIAAKTDFAPAVRACRIFTASFAPGGRSPEDSYSYFGDNGLFDAGIPALCAPAAGAKEIKVTGKGGAAGIDLDLRDVPLPDALAILASLSGDDLAADPSLPAYHIDLTARGATLQELMASLRAAGPGAAGEPAPGGSRLAEMEFSEGALQPGDYELAGFGKRNGDEYFAVAYKPNRRQPSLITDYAWLGGEAHLDAEGIKVKRDDGSVTVLKRP